jgi:hypothetical protein
VGFQRVVQDLGGTRREALADGGFGDLAQVLDETRQVHGLAPSVGMTQGVLV